MASKVINPVFKRTTIKLMDPKYVLLSLQWQQSLPRSPLGTFQSHHLSPNSSVAVEK